MNKQLQKAFPGFDNKFLETLEDKAELRTFEPGEVLMKTGQYFKSILLVVDGLIKVYREDEEGHEYFMYYLQPGQACALSMVSAGKQEKSEVMGKVVKPTTVIAVPLQYMDSWMQDHKSWYQFVMNTYRQRFEELLITLDHTFRSMDEKLLSYLKGKAGAWLQPDYHQLNTEVAQSIIPRSDLAPNEKIGRAWYDQITA